MGGRIRSLATLVVLAISLAAAQLVDSASPPWEVYFSPKGGATQAVVNALAGTHTAVFVQAYSFTSAPIAKALVDAHKRGSGWR